MKTLVLAKTNVLSNRNGPHIFHDILKGKIFFLARINVVNRNEMIDRNVILSYFCTPTTVQT